MPNATVDDSAQVLEAVHGFRVSFLSLCIFLGYEFGVMAVWGQFELFTKRIALKTSVKSMTVVFVVKYIGRIK